MDVSVFYYHKMKAEFLSFLFFFNVNKNSITFLHQTLYFNSGPENISFFSGNFKGTIQFYSSNTQS